jgi:hypothetical protein
MAKGLMGMGMDMVGEWEVMGATVGMVVDTEVMEEVCLCTEWEWEWEWVGLEDSEALEDQVIKRL